MKTIRKYLTGCTWCNATGFIDSTFATTTSAKETCPVCHGSKTIEVTETFEDDWLKQIKDMMPKSIL